MACANLVYPNGFTRPFGGDWGGFLGGFSSLLIAAQPIRFPVPRFPRGAGCRISNCARFAAETDNHCALTKRHAHRRRACYPEQFNQRESIRCFGDDPHAGLTRQRAARHAG